MPKEAHARQLSRHDRLMLLSAISTMSSRYGAAMRDHAVISSSPYNPATADADLAADAKAFRAVWRRRAALDRLVLALAEVNR